MPIHLLSPLWLLTLLPWTALAAWLLWGRRQRTNVPFLALWRGQVTDKPLRRALKIPPIALVLFLLSLLMAIVAAARPAWDFYLPAGGPPLTIVLDRGITMSAPQRLEQMLQEALPHILGAADFGPTRYVAVPGGVLPREQRYAMQEILDLAPPTAIDTRQQLQSTVASELARSRGTVIVFSDQPLGVEDPRLIQIPPRLGLRNVGITHLAARAQPRSQVMVRLKGRSFGQKIRLTIETNEQKIQREVEVPSDLTEFIDVAALGPTVQASLGAADDLPADNQAWLVREQAWPVVEAMTDVSPELARMIATYQKLRPDSATSKRIRIVDSLERADGPSVIVSNSTVTVAGEVEVSQHPVTRDVNWLDAMKGATASEAPTDWMPLVQKGEKTVLAARDSAARQVWIGFDSPDLARSPDWVIFWTNVLNWVGEGSEAFAYHHPVRLEPEWQRIAPADAPETPAGLWPGLYRRSDGQLMAINAPPVDLPQLPRLDWYSQLLNFGEAHRDKVSMSPPLLVAALCCLILSAWCWPKRNLTAIFTPRTV